MRYGHVQSERSALVRCIRIGTIFKQRDDRVHVPLHRGVLECGRTNFSKRIYLCTLIQKFGNLCRVAVHRGNMKWQASDPVHRTHVNRPFHQCICWLNRMEVRTLTFPIK